MTASTTTIYPVQPGIGSADLQALIDAAPAGATLQLQAGSYTLDRPLVIDRDDISIVGAGSENTVVSVDQSSGWTGDAITVTGSRSWTPIATTADTAEGASNLKLAAGHGVAAGEWLWIEAGNTPEFLASIGDTEWLKDKPLRTSLVKVEAVTGDGVVLEGGVHFDFPQGETSVYKVDPASNVTLSGFSVQYGHGDATPGAFENTLSQYEGDAAFMLEWTDGAALQDIAVLDPVSSGFVFAHSSGVTAADLHAEGAHNKGSGGNGYAVELKAVYESEFAGLSDLGMRHSLVFGSWYSSVNNTVEVDSTDRDVNFHGGRDHHNSVLVHSSVRTADVDGMSSVLSINAQGASYGAPTDMTHNQVGFEHVVGTKRTDLVLGTGDGDYLDAAGGHDTVYGFGGDDTLVGGSGDSWGDDALFGGAGHDTAILPGVRADYGVALDENPYRLWFNDHLLEGIETVQFAGDGSVMDLAAEVSGYLTDWSEAALSADEPAGGGTIVGTAGRDLYQIADSSLEIVEQPDGGWDTVESWVDYTLDANVEKLELMGEAADGTGNDDRNVLLGNAGANTLRGEGGDDALYGRAGNDKLYGSSGDDYLDGGGGNDVLMGGGGADTLRGGSGADRFEFTKWDLGKLQLVQDFDFAEGDRVDLSRIDADSGALGEQAFRYIGGQTFSGQAGELRLANGTLEGDVDGDSLSDLLVQMPDNTWIPGDGFIL